MRKLTRLILLTFYALCAVPLLLTAQATFTGVPANNGDPAEYVFTSIVNPGMAVFYDFGDGFFSTTKSTTFTHYYQMPSNTGGGIVTEAHKKDPYAPWGLPERFGVSQNFPASTTPAPHVTMNRNIKISRAMLNSVGGQNVYVVTIANLNIPTSIAPLGVDGTVQFNISPEVHIINQKEYNNGNLLTPLPNNLERKWSFSNLKYGEKRNFFIYTQSQSFPLGSRINSNAKIESTNPAYMAIQDEAFDFTAMAADPNDPNVMYVNKPCIDPNHLFDQHLVYLVRFQNEGTAPAEDVLVNIRLPQHIDPNSIKPLFSSHQGATWSVSGNTLSVEYIGINLPGSNEPQGEEVIPYSDTEGWFSYSLCTVPNIAPNEILSSDANIIFSTQGPIPTNTVETISTYDCMEDVSLCEDFIDVPPGNIHSITYDNPDPDMRSFENTESTVTLSPNPAQNSISFHFSEKEQNPRKLEVYDSAGRHIFTQKVDHSTNTFYLDIADWDNGLYYYGISFINKINSGKFIKL
ncbi:MAG: T9SS type A sorting domain-containing protein [Bacteroidota bacterium]